MSIKSFFDNFASSGWEFDVSERTQKSRFEMFNITVLLSTVGLFYGLILNSVVGNPFLFLIELCVLLFNAAVLYAIRRSRDFFDTATTTFVIVFIALFTILILNSDPQGVKHIWVYTFPAVILFFKGTKNGIFWTVMLTSILVLTHTQPFFETSYSLYQISYISFVLMIMTAIVMFYQYKMDQDNELIFDQKRQLESFAHDLESKIEDKTAELRELNATLEAKVQEKLDVIRHKDALLLAQSRQAVMGEMLSMIAHQWRQPLSTITLQISNLKISSMLGKNNIEEVHNGLANISDTVMYLSDTIDDFQNFFHPEKAPETIALCDLVKQALNFTEARMKVHDIHLDCKCDTGVDLSIYTKEVIQVFINILNNAADQLMDIHDREKQIRVTAVSDDTHAYISIEDSGGGIEENVMPFIFDPYFSTKEKNGTGLGLYMGKMIIESHLDGKLSAENTAKGAKFTMTLPLNAIN